MSIKQKIIRSGRDWNMKKEYMKPTMFAEEFVANEYVAACGDANKVYKFTCDAGGGASGEVYIESNGKDGLQVFEQNPDTHRTRGWTRSYHACNITHEASATDEFQFGYFVPEWSLKVIPVMVWYGPDGKNTHCTENVQMSSWITEKS